MTADIQASHPPKPTPAKKRNIPEHLIKETIDGIPFYYAGFESVLNKTKTKTDIMADSGLQSFIKAFLMSALLKVLDTKNFAVLVGEIGSHLDHRTNLALDLAIFDRKLLTAKKINLKYVDIAPKIVIEVDVRVELAEDKESVFDEFVLRKVRKLHEFGTEKIIWIFTKNKKVMVATPGQPWLTLDWSVDVEVVDGLVINLAEIVAKKKG